MEFAGRAVPADMLGTGSWTRVVTPLGTARFVIAVVKLEFIGRAVPADKRGTGSRTRVVTPSGTARFVIAVVKLEFIGRMPELIMNN